MFSILNRALCWAITSFGHKFCLKKRSRLIKALDNRIHVKFMQLEIGLLYQSASKHGRRTFLKSVMRELVCNGATLDKSGSKTVSQLQGRTARAFSCNSLVKTTEITVVIQYI